MPQDKEKKEISSQNEDINTLEKNPSGNIIDYALEEKAIKVAEIELNEPFDSFDPVSYMKEFYAELNPVFALRVMEIIENSEQKEGTKTVIDIRTIQEIMKKESMDFGIKSLESLENCCINDFMLRKAVPEILKDRPEDHLKILDIGGGPTIYQHIPLMGITDSITHSEYLKANRDEINNWKDGKSNFNWKSFFATYKSYLETHPDISKNATQEVQDHFKEITSQEIEKTENQLREKIKNVLYVDVFRENLGMVEDDESFDLIKIGKEGSIGLITSNFCIESATDNHEFWERGIANVTAKVPKDGFLLMTAIRNASWYKVGDEQMPAVPVNAESLSVELKKQGFEIKIVSEIIGSEKEVVGYDGMVFVLAKRIEI